MTEQRPGRGTLILLAVHVVLFFSLVWYSRLYASTYIDDAFIQLQYAKNLAHTWGLPA